MNNEAKRAEMLAMMRDYQRRDVSWFVGSGEILDVEIISDLSHTVRGVKLTLTS